MNIAMILAGGSGTRMGIEMPKQFIEVQGKPLIIYTMEAFQENDNIDAIVMVVRSDYRDQLEKWIKQYDISKVKWIAENGDTRQHSVENGLNIIDEGESEDIILIHDGARPLISRKIIDDNIEAVKKFGAVNTVVPCTDTIVKSISGETSDEVPNRSEYYLCQTPQSFKLGLIRKAHDYAKEHNNISATDDCQLITFMGGKVYLAHGNKLNFKVTTKDDLTILEAILNKF